MQDREGAEINQGLAELQNFVGCTRCVKCDKDKIGTKDQCKGEGYMTPPYQSPGRMECRHLRTYQGAA